MHSYLVRSPRFKTNLGKRIFFAPGDYTVICNGGLPVRRNDSFNNRIPLSRYRSVYLSFVGRMSAAYGIVGLFKTFLQLCCAETAFGADNAAGRISVKAIYRTKSNTGKTCGKKIPRVSP